MTYRNAPIHPILRLIYAWLRLTTWAGFSVFYRRRLVLGREHLRFDGPAIIVSNHPSTLMDPLNVGLNIRQEMFFLANYGLFKNPISSWILTRLFCIPVKRKEDVAEGEARDNDAAFEASYQHLEKNGVLYIAAEGVSWMDRYVRPFKTGTARIAFGAERRNNWQLGVKIIPVGLSYDAPNLFRSRMTVEYGAPIDPRPWAEKDRENHEQAVDNFTEAIRQRVSALTLDSGSEAGDSFVNQLEMMLRNARLDFSESEAYFFLKDFLVKNMGNEDFKTEVARYSATLEKAGLTDAGVNYQSDNPKNWGGFLTRAYLFLLIAPFALIGYPFWFLPCWLPSLLCKRLKLYPGYDSNVKMLAGLFTFPLALWGGWELAFWIWGSSLWAWVALAVLVFCGYGFEAFSDIAQIWRERRAARLFQEKQPRQWEKISAQRNEIFKEMLAGPYRARLRQMKAEIKGDPVD
ncbi:MAG: 1-acyl-sn-glycerol-3-phosphate acyltransferase [Saprospiraceae bacterium]|nr:1-acyl-sn-glycerol-3-phosphate acyltransferase [Saprospiraceae bacterium]